MKNYRLLICTFSFITTVAFSQKEVSISDLQSPTSPGFILLDQTPASVDKPTTPKSIVLSVLNLKNGGALEIAPYWFIKKITDNLTFDNYIKNKTPIFQTLSFSVATSKSESGNTFVSGGFRVNPFRVFRKSINQKVDSLIMELSETNLNIDRITQLQNDVTNERKNPLFMVQVAGAVAGASKTNTFEDITGNKNGIWANARLNPNNDFSITILGRYIKNKNNLKVSDNSSYTDFGFSLSYEINNFSFSGEGVFRKDNILNSKYQRVALVSNYKINENIYIVGSFGKNFQNIDNIIALFGINVGLSKKSVLIN